jgi:hypothetical protein
MERKAIWRNSPVGPPHRHPQWHSRRGEADGVLQEIPKVGQIEVLGGSAKGFILSGERGRNRTFNLLIKSQLLCQLSYAPGLKDNLFTIPCTCINRNRIRPPVGCRIAARR